MSENAAARPAKPLRLLLWLSVPIAVGAIVASLAGLFVPSAYEAETANWAAQGRGQDAANLVLYPALLVLAWRAARGSLSAWLGWAGLLAYSAYSYLLYAGWVHFGGFFLLYVAVFGLSVYGLIGSLAVLDPVRVRAAFLPSAPTRRVGTVLAVLGAMFGLLWLSEIVPPTLDGTVPETITEAGLVSNPVWVLDLALVLPAMIVAGLLLRRGRPLGYLLAAPLLVFGIAMGTAIVGMFAALAIAGEAAAAAPAVLIVVVVAVEIAALVGLLRHRRADVTVVDVLRDGSRPTTADSDREPAAPRPVVRAS